MGEELTGNPITGRFPKRQDSLPRFRLGRKALSRLIPRPLHRSVDPSGRENSSTPHWFDLYESTAGASQRDALPNSVTPQPLGAPPMYTVYETNQFRGSLPTGRANRIRTRSLVAAQTAPYPKPRKGHQVPILQEPTYTETDVAQLVDRLRTNNEANGFTSRNHPVAYDINVADEYETHVQDLPAADEWPPEPATMMQRLQQLSHDPHSPHQAMNLLIRNPSKTHTAFVLAAPMYTVTPGGGYRSPPEPQYFVSLGQYLSNVRRETLHETVALLTPELVAPEAESLHAVWIGGQRASVPGEEMDRMSCNYEHVTPPRGSRVNLAELIQFVWKSIEDSEDLRLPDGRTDFRMVILDGTPEPPEAMPMYPDIPIPPGVAELQSIHILQRTADDPMAGLRIEVNLGRYLPLVTTVQLIAGVLPELIPYAFENPEELNAAVAQRRRQ